MELKREKRNTKTSTRTPPWLATLFLMLDDDKVDDECEPDALNVPAQMFYKRQHTLSSIAGSMSSGSGTSSSPRLLSPSAGSSSCKRSLMYRTSDSPSKYLTSCTPTFYYDKVQDAAMMMVDGKVPTHLQPVVVILWGKLPSFHSGVVCWTQLRHMRWLRIVVAICMC